MDRAAVVQIKGPGITKSLSKIYPRKLYHGKWRISIKSDGSGEGCFSQKLSQALQGYKACANNGKVISRLLKLMLPSEVPSITPLIDNVVQELLRLKCAWTRKAIHHVLTKCGFFTRLGSLVDAEIKRMFEENRGSLVNHLKNAYGWTPMCGGIKVSSARGSNTCPVCKDPPPVTVCSPHSTEIDVIARDAQENYILLEIKTHSASSVEANSIKKYQLQTWLSEHMFRNTFGLCDTNRVQSYILFVDPYTMKITNVMPVPKKRRRVTGNIWASYPSILHLCTLKRKKKKTQ